jgi:hypothetical protein
MRKTILLGGLLAVFLIFTLPTVSAVESVVVQSSKASSYHLTAQDIDLEKIQAKYSNNPTPQTFFLLTLAILFLKLLRLSMILPILIVLIYLRLLSL